MDSIHGREGILREFLSEQVQEFNRVWLGAIEAFLQREGVTPENAQSVELRQDRFAMKGSLYRDGVLIGEIEGSVTEDASSINVTIRKA